MKKKQHSYTPKHEFSVNIKKNLSKDHFRNIEEINRVRKRDGMSELDVRKRECLRCGKTFDSEGIHNRMCATCRVWGPSTNEY